MTGEDGLCDDVWRFGVADETQGFEPAIGQGRLES